MKKRAIFTYSNFQINPDIIKKQQEVIKKFNTIPNCTYEYLFYNAPDGELFPCDALNHGVNTLFYERDFDTILILDIDCVPLSTYALAYTFLNAENGTMTGNIQRSNHIDNNQHVFVAPSALCISKDYYNKLGRTSFIPSKIGDVAELLTYQAEDFGMAMEMYMPTHSDAPAWDFLEEKEMWWDLKDGMPKYGIGTTFSNKYGEQMFYHLFQSRLALHNKHFFKKCEELLTQ